MIARAPGKLVLSGAYSVLFGAPSLVAAVDRFVVADSLRMPERVTAEVASAIERGDLKEAPWFDAQALRQRGDDGKDRKIGLGSSAAILVASMAACARDYVHHDVSLADRIFPGAWRAHRDAQGGGSGIDVAAACYGGVLRCELNVAVHDDRSLHAPVPLEVVPYVLPAGLCIEMYACPTSASTMHLLSAVDDFQKRRPSRHRAMIDTAAEGAMGVCMARDAFTFVRAWRAQLEALRLLGQAADVPIVTDEMAQLDAIAHEHGACFAPSGAGGGDVAVRFGTQAATPAFLRRAGELGLQPLTLRLGAEGVCRMDQ